MPRIVFLNFQMLHILRSGSVLRIILFSDLCVHLHQSSQKLYNGKIQPHFPGMRFCVTHIQNVKGKVQKQHIILWECTRTASIFIQFRYCNTHCTTLYSYSYGLTDVMFSLFSMFLFLWRPTCIFFFLFTQQTPPKQHYSVTEWHSCALIEFTVFFRELKHRAVQHPSESTFHIHEYIEARKEKSGCCGYF